MKQLTLLSLGLCFLLIFSCKKKDKTDTQDTPETPVIPTTFNGLLILGKYTYGFNNTNSVSDSARAYFSNEAIKAINAGAGLRAGSVFLNGDSLQYSNFNTLYMKIDPVSTDKETWQVTGANNIPAFTYVNTIPFPGSDPITSFPDTVRKSQGFSVTINNVTNAKNAFFVIEDGTHTPAGTYSVTLKIGNNTVNVGSESLSGFSSGAGAYMLMVLENFSTSEFSSKFFKFSKETQYVRFVKIKP